MSDLFPERPLHFYPSLAIRFGVDEALLLSILEELFRFQSTADQHSELLLLAPDQLNQLTPFWSRERLEEILFSLNTQAVMQVSLGKSGSVKLIRKKQQKPAPRHDNLPKEVTSISEAPTLPVYDTPPARKPSSPRSPAPMFGGNAGWRRGKDELQQIFEQHEERNQRLVPMELGWKPSGAFFDMLSRQSISVSFAEQCLDEFILYWLDKDRKETNWDQKFLAWVKREWVHKQSRDASGRMNEQQTPGQQNENTRRDTRENRKRVTASIMDIEDTNW